MSAVYHLKSFVYITLTLLVYSYSGFAQIPSNYYTTAEGKTGYNLKTELFFIIDNHTDRGYSALWTLYYTSDDKANGKVWDMYSDIPNGTPPYEYTFGNDQCGNYSGEGSCYNREHSFPKSWFSDASPMVNDAHHIVPTDGYVNGQRASLPYGETSSASWTAQNGSKKGSSSINGYSGTIFEPIDEYKGDFARIYFYMATRYESQIDSWSSPMLNGTESQAFQGWALEMLLSWHQNDPVSQKEIDRNEAIFDFQGNRNPFVDHPEWVRCIWQSDCGIEPSPKLESNLSSLNYGVFSYGNQRPVKNLTLTGSQLTSEVSISLNSNDFLISTNASSGFGSTLSISADAAGDLQQTIYVMLDPQENVDQQINASITISQMEVEDLAIQLSATIKQVVTSTIELNFLFDTLTAQVDNPLYEVIIQANKKLEEPLQIALKLAEFKEIFYPAQFSTEPTGTGTTVPLTMASGDSLAKLSITLDTTQLKTVSQKSFAVSLVDNGNYLIGEKNTFFFILEGYNPPITSGRNKELYGNILTQNPVKDYLCFNTVLLNTHCMIIDKSGQIIQQNNDLVVQTIDVSTLSAGLYYLIIIREDDGSRSINKFIKH